MYIKYNAFLIWPGICLAQIVSAISIFKGVTMTRTKLSFAKYATFILLSVTAVSIANAANTFQDSINEADAHSSESTTQSMSFETNSDTFSICACVTNVTFPITHPITVSPIPEPDTYAMFLAGLGILGWKIRTFRRFSPIR